MVANPSINKSLDDLHSYIKLCLDAIKEWCSLADDAALDRDDKALAYLSTWENGKVWWFSPTGANGIVR